MKKALLGLANNIGENIEKVKLWALSFKKYSNGEVMLLCANANPSEIQMCERLGIKCIEVNLPNTHEINHERLKYTVDSLKSTDIDLLLITDVYDVAFQGDPFVKLDTSNYDIFISGEGLLVEHEVWNTDNINKLFPSEFQKCRKTEVMNSGVIAGKRTSLISLYESMYNLCENSTDKHNIKDQAALIVMVSNNQIKNIKVFNLDDGWAMHCAVAGPTYFFDAWDFKKNIRYGIPQMKDNHIVNKFGNKYDIVHQFNRVAEWHELIKKNNNL
jgi:hypothetical protein